MTYRMRTLPTNTRKQWPRLQEFYNKDKSDMLSLRPFDHILDNIQEQRIVIVEDAHAALKAVGQTFRYPRDEQDTPEYVEFGATLCADEEKGRGFHSALLKLRLMETYFFDGKSIRDFFCFTYSKNRTSISNISKAGFVRSDPNPTIRMLTQFREEELLTKDIARFYHMPGRTMQQEYVKRSVRDLLYIHDSGKLTGSRGETEFIIEHEFFKNSGTLERLRNFAAE